MRKINNKKSLVLGDGNGNYVPNIIRGGNAIPLGNNFYYIKGRKHSAGGVDIGADPKTGLEVEGEEVMKVSPKEVRVYSSVPFLQGNSPAELVMGGANPDAVFKAQEEFKDRNRINDDGTKYENGGKIYDASKNYKRAAKAREWTDALVGLFDPTPISGVLDIINARNNDRSNAEMVLAGLSVLPGARVLSKLTRGLGRLTKNQSLIKEDKKISDVVNRDKTLQKAISSFNQSARDRTLAEQMRRREIYTTGGDVDLDRVQGEHIKNYNKAIHYFDRYNKLSDSNWANYENFAAASRGINTAVDAYNIGKESVNLVTDENKTNKKKLVGGNLPTNQNDFLDTWNASRLATGRYNNQLGDGRLERQAESRNTAREFHSPIGFAMNYGKRAAIRTPSMSDTDYRKDNVAMHNDPNQLNLNNINLNTVPVYAAKYGTKRKSKMGKVISINGNVRNGLIHTPSREAFAYGGERKPRFNGRYSKPGLHNLSLLASAIFLPKGTVDKEPEKPRRIGWVDAHNRLVGADISQKPLDAKQDNTSVAHVISETEKRTRKFAAGGRKKAKAGKDSIQTDSIPERYYIPLDKANLSGANLIDFAKYARVENENKPAGIRLPKSSLVTPKNIVHNEPTIAKVADFPFDGSINAKSISRAERNVGARGRLNTEENGYNKIEELLNRVRELGTDAQGKNDIPMTFDEYTNPQADYTYDYASRNNRSISNLNRLGIAPRLYGNLNRVNPSADTNIPAAEIINEVVNNASKNVSSSTGGGSGKSIIPVTRTLDGSKVTPASNAEMAGITHGLAPTIVNRLAKNVNNDINHLSILDNLKRPYQKDIVKTRNLDNIQFGINIGSSVIDALMGNIFANQLHSYTPPTITAPVISNPGEIKLNKEDLKDIPEPILMAAAKLKTRYNANPQLAKIEDETRRTMRDIDRNTSNSRVGLARKQLAALRGQEAKNQVYAQKENIETELINKDKLNQQEVTARNLARYDQYNQALAAQMANRARLRLAADTANIQNKLAVSTANANLKAQADQFNAGNRINSLIHKAGIDGAKAEARANIISNLLGNVGSAFDIWNRNKRQARLDEETLKVLGLRAPNVNKLMLRALGINE